MTVTLSNGATINIAAGASSGTVSVAAPGEDVYVDAGSVSATISGASGGNFEALAINPAAATTSVTDTINTTTVSTERHAERGRRRQHRLHRFADPRRADAGDGRPVQRRDDHHRRRRELGHGERGGTRRRRVCRCRQRVGHDQQRRRAATSRTLAVNPAAATTSVTDTINTTTLSLTGAATIIEGNSGSYTVSLTSAAQTAVTVNLAYSGTATNGADYTGLPASRSRPAPQRDLQHRDLDDALADSGETMVVSVASATGGNFESLVVSGSANSVTTTINDEAVPDTVLVSLSGPGSVVEGATTTAYTVTLGQAAVTR